MKGMARSPDHAPLLVFSTPLLYLRLLFPLHRPEPLHSARCSQLRYLVANGASTIGPYTT
jgi:hypothetical protein